MKEKVLVKMYFGSKVFGTSVPDSDTDIKFVFQPTKESLLLENPAKQIQNKNDSSRKNTKDDVDLEGFSLKQYLYHLASGQTFALSMLFTPEQFWFEKPDPVWNIIRENKDKLISKRVNAFVGYCRAQFLKYCVKSERLEAVEDVVSVLNSLSHTNPTMKLEVYLSVLEEIKKNHPGIVEIDYEKKMFECCGRKAPFGITNERAYEVYNKLYKTYGERTKLASEQGNIDWKALYHAVRVAREAEEILLTGNITYPRPEAPLLLDIRKKNLSYSECSVLIEDGLKRVESAMEKSTLRDDPDWGFINDLVMENNYREIIREVL